MSLLGLSCIFPVPDIEQTANYYVTKLGFHSVKYLNSQEPHICLYKDKTEIILLQANIDKVLPNRELYGYGYDAYFYSEHQEQLEKTFKDTGVKIVRPLNMTDYQNKEFVIEDIDGRWIAFGHKTDK